MMSLVSVLQKTIALVLLLIILSACGNSGEPTAGPASIVVQKSAFRVLVRADGELSAANTVPLTLPPGNVMPRTIVWLADDGKWVEEGEVIARFDRSFAERSLREVLTQLQKSDLDIDAKKREFSLALNKITADILVTLQELGVAERFSIEEGSIAMSRQEMIERMQDAGFLRLKQDHFKKRQSGQENRRQAELAVLGAQRESASSKGSLLEQQIEASVTRAPNAGYFVRKKSWLGESLSAGQTVFPGNSFGEIPELGKMQAILQVLESEAGSIAVGQKVSVSIDAFPDRPLDGIIDSMAQVPASLEQNSPIKYFAVTVSLEQADPDWITPGARVRGLIEILDKPAVLWVPNQSIRQSIGQLSGGGVGGETGGQSSVGEKPSLWVYLKAGRNIEKRYIEIGDRGPLRTEITAGLAIGDEILLTPPVNQSGAAE
ncbi:MAG: efflux RND transporter periplasmic adaptor subunit [Xanthomonadales bacterium]|nr:efflux RND transporter periplasmic adaptor subunit [Xanthomonadales bacterium]